jgi:hypothetical protein
MRRVGSFAVPFVLAVIVLSGAPARSSAADVCDGSLPSNIDAGTVAPIAVSLLQQSSTFRQQCQRIAATVVLRVQIRIVRPQAGSRGESTIRRFDSGALRVEIALSFGDDYGELLAHEFEHVLEQVDGVNLAQQVSTGRAWLTPGRAFETTRAVDAGIRVRHERDLSAAEAVEPHRGAAPRLRHPFD